LRDGKMLIEVRINNHPRVKVIVAHTKENVGEWLYEQKKKFPNVTAERIGFTDVKPKVSLAIGVYKEK